MHILITGGLGNLGSWLVRACIEAGHDVTTLSSRNRKLIFDGHFNRLFADISDTVAVNAALGEQQFDVIVHLASVNEGNAPGYARTALETNTWGTRVMLDWAAMQPVKPHFIYFSTFHAYGRGAGPVHEELHPLPQNDYGTTHLFAEYYVQQIGVAKQLPYTIFRLTNSYGQPLDLDSSKWYLVLNDLCKSAVRQQVVKLGSNGKPVRDFVWMGDVADVVLKCVQKGPANTIFNLGGGQVFSMLQVAESVALAYAQKTGKTIPVVVNEADHNQYDPSLVVSIAKLQSWIGYSPQNRLVQEASNIITLLLGQS